MDELEKIKFDYTLPPIMVEDEMTENEKKEFYSEGSLLSKNKVLNKILDHLLQINGDYLVRKAANQEQLFWGRANINAIELIKEELTRINNMYLDSLKVEDFDKNNII